MRFETHLWPERLKAVEKEYLATKFATLNFMDRSRHDSSLLPANLRFSEFRRSSENQEGTYTVRLFSEFETGLRTFWSVTRPKAPPSRAKDLIDGIASYRRIAPHRVASVHNVRLYRNLLVHERDETIELIPLDVARRYLCVFLSHLH